MGRVFFFNDTATTEIYTLSLHDALPILPLHLRNAPTGLMKGLGYGKGYQYAHDFEGAVVAQEHLDRKSTRLNSSHANISYAVFCLKKKTKNLGARTTHLLRGHPTPRPQS